MRKLFTLMAALVVAIVANAQKITFSEAAAAGTLNGATFGTGLVLTVTDLVDGGKVSIDDNKCKFGTAAEYVQYTQRLKTGGKSSDKNALSLTVPSAGTLKVSARTASSSSPRAIVLTQNGTEVMNQTLDDTNFEESEDGKVFPVYSCSVEAGTVDISYLDGAINIYAIELESAGGNPAGSASYEVNITSDPENGFYSGDLAFEWGPIAKALGLADAAALQSHIAAGGNVFIELASGLSNAYTGNPNEFWMNTAGIPQGYSDEGTSWFVGLSFDVEEGADVSTGVVDIYMGQMPNFFSKIYEPTTLKVKLFLLNGDNKVSFDVTLNVNAAERLPEMAEPETDLTKITIVKEYTGVIDFVEGKSYEGKTVAFDAADLAAALGIDDATLNPNLSNVTLVQKVITDDNAGTVEFTNELINERESTDGWFGRYTSFDEATGEETSYDQNGLRGWGGGCTYYLQNPALEEGQFTIVAGQYPGTMAAGAKDYAVLYVVNGNKAVKITYNVNVHEPEKVEFSAMTKAGEQTIDGSLEVASSYTSAAVTVDVADILEKLGAESADDLTGWMLGDEASLADPTTTDYWQGEEGFAQSWGDNACCQVKVDLANGTANLLQMPRYTEITEPQTFPMHFIYTYGDKYYQLNFNFTLTPIKKIEVETHIVSEEEFSMQIVPSPDTYVYGETYKLDMDYIEKLIGTRNYALYGDKWNADTESLEWDKTYTCYDGDEKGAGFWFGDTTYENKEHQVVVDNAGWGQNSFGFQLSALGVFTWFQYPGQRTAGDQYAANIYLVNEETGAYVKYTLNIIYVEEVSGEIEEVGGEVDKALAPSEQAKEGAFYIDIDTEDLYEALGLTDETIDAATVVVAKSKTIFYSTNFGESFGVNANGYYADLDNTEAVNVIASITTENGKPQIFVDAMDLDFTSLETSATINFGFEYDGKRYIMEYEILGGSKTVGATDNSTGWWSAFSDYYTITKNQVVYVHFKNFSNKAENWNNWLFVANAAGTERGGEGYSEHFVLRADNWAWNGLGDMNSNPSAIGTITNQYDWATFKEDMDGSKVVMAVYIKDEAIILDATIFTKDGKMIPYEFKSAQIPGIEATSFFLTTENGHLEDLYVEFDDDDADAIVAPAAPAASSAAAGIYTISGAKVESLQKGINIVKMEDGSVKKIMVK